MLAVAGATGALPSGPRLGCVKHPGNVDRPKLVPGVLTSSIDARAAVYVGMRAHLLQPLDRLRWWWARALASPRRPVEGIGVV
jgi:hypothetical protein